MNRLLLPRFATRLTAATALAFALAAPAQAVLNGPLTVSLIAPGGDITQSTPFTFAQIVDPAIGISVGDGTAIGSYMLPGEEIKFDDNSILIHVAVGFDDMIGNLSTGILGANGQHARYEFDGLSVTGQTITGITVYALNGYVRSGGVSGVLGGIGVSLLSPNRLQFNLDDLRFLSNDPIASQNFGEFRIDLLTQPVPVPVPEPSSWALLLAGLVGVGHFTRRAKARSDAA